MEKEVSAFIPRTPVFERYHDVEACHVIVVCTTARRIFWEAMLGIHMLNMWEKLLFSESGRKKKESQQKSSNPLNDLFSTL